MKAILPGEKAKQTRGFNKRKEIKNENEWKREKKTT